MLRQFPTALKLYDRALDLLPNDPDLMAGKARMYQAEGNLQEAAKLLVAVNAQTPSLWSLAVKITQLRLERNLGEAVRLLQARQAQYHFVLRSTRPLISACWLSRSAWPAILLGQRLPVNRRAIRSSGSAKINQTTLRLRHGYL